MKHLFFISTIRSSIGLGLSLLMILLLIDPSAGGRKGRYTATDLQVFNPSFSARTANVQWVDQNGAFQANLPIDIGPRASQYFTPELSGLVPSTFIGGIEVISETGTLFATVTHFDKGPGAPDFERGNEHYEVRANDSAAIQLNAPVLIVSGTTRSNISILSSIDARPVTVTLQFHRDSGVVAASLITTVVGNALIDVTSILSGALPFSGSARLFSNQSIGGYVSIYDGETQKGYSLIPKPLPVLDTRSNLYTQYTQLPDTFTRSIFPNVQPTDDEFITRTLYVQNIDLFQAGVVIRTRFGPLFTGTIPALGQIAFTLPYSKAINELFLDSDQYLTGVLLVDDANAADRDQITGAAAYPALSPDLDRAYRNSNATNVPNAPNAANHCAVAPTVFGGYQGWQTSLRLVNNGDISGTAVITYFPAIGASNSATPIVVSRVLTPGISVIPDYEPIANSNAAWSAYVEADVPFFGDVTSVKSGIADGIMAYRMEPTTCVITPLQMFIPLALR